jgi:hypothetical protein
MQAVPLPFLVYLKKNFEVCCVTTVPFAREPLPKLALLGSPSPPGYTSLRAEVQRVPYSSHIPARQSCPGAALVPVAPHSLRITPSRADGGGPIECTGIWPRRSYRHPGIQSSARTRPVRPSRKICTSFFTARNELYEDRDSCAEQRFAVGCTICGEVQAYLRAVLARPFVG